MIGNLSSEQLEELQDIMERNHDEMTEFDLISGELAEMGVEEEDIVDLKLLGSMMNTFVSSPLVLDHCTVEFLIISCFHGTRIEILSACTAHSSE